MHLLKDGRSHLVVWMVQLELALGLRQLPLPDLGQLLLLLLIEFNLASLPNLNHFLFDRLEFLWPRRPNEVIKCFCSCSVRVQRLEEFATTHSILITA